jgi:hypothetical protein
MVLECTRHGRFEDAGRVRVSPAWGLGWYGEPEECWGEGLGRVMRLGCKRGLVFSDRTDGSRGGGVRIRYATPKIKNI